MFNRLPGAMLPLGHTHQWRKGRNCSRVLSQHTAAIGTPHRHSLFNPAQPEAQLLSSNLDQCRGRDDPSAEIHGAPALPTRPPGNEP